MKSFPEKSEEGPSGRRDPSARGHASSNCNPQIEHINTHRITTLRATRLRGNPHFATDVGETQTFQTSQAFQTSQTSPTSQTGGD